MSQWDIKAAVMEGLAGSGKILRYVMSNEQQTSWPMTLKQFSKVMRQQIDPRTRGGAYVTQVWLPRYCECQLVHFGGL